MPYIENIDVWIIREVPLMAVTLNFPKSLKSMKKAVSDQPDERPDRPEITYRVSQKSCIKAFSSNPPNNSFKNFNPQSFTPRLAREPLMAQVTQT